MHKLFASLILSALALPLAAQDGNKVQVFGGYQFLHVGSFDGDGDSAANTSGWTESTTFKLYKRLGITADFSGNYRSEAISNSVLSSTPAPAQIRIYTYTFGPTATLYSHGGVNLFAHGLFGGAHMRPTGCVIFSGSPDECGSGGYTGFTAMLGGGVDVKSSPRLAFRAAQFDWVRLPYQFASMVSTSQSNFRLSTGVVFRF